MCWHTHFDSSDTFISEQGNRFKTRCQQIVGRWIHWSKASGFSLLAPSKAPPDPPGGASLRMAILTLPWRLISEQLFVCLIVSSFTLLNQFFFYNTIWVIFFFLRNCYEMFKQLHVSVMWFDYHSGQDFMDCILRWFIHIERAYYGYI